MIGRELPFVTRYTAIQSEDERAEVLRAALKQLFAQVTNPAIDPIREELVMSLTGYIGSFQDNLLHEGPEHSKMIRLSHKTDGAKTFALVSQAVRTHGKSLTVWQASTYELVRVFARSRACPAPVRKVTSGPRRMVLRRISSGMEGMT